MIGKDEWVRSMAAVKVSKEYKPYYRVNLQKMQDRLLIIEEKKHFHLKLQPISRSSNTDALSCTSASPTDAV